MKSQKPYFSTKSPTGEVANNFIFIFLNKESKIIIKQKHKAKHFSQALILRNVLLKSGPIKNVFKIRIIREKFKP
jgi:hypothetical protein